MEFVLGSFSCFNIEIAYSNFTFCGAWTPGFFAFRWKLSEFQQNKHTPGMSHFRNMSKCPPPRNIQRLLLTEFLISLQPQCQWMIYIDTCWTSQPFWPNFLHFHAVSMKIWRDNRLPPHWGWRLPLGNPGSVTKCHESKLFSFEFEFNSCSIYYFSFLQVK